MHANLWYLRKVRCPAMSREPSQWMNMLEGQTAIKKTRVKWESGLTRLLRGNDICAGPGTLSRAQLCQDLEDSIWEATIKCKVRSRLAFGHSQAESRWYKREVMGPNKETADRGVKSKGQWAWQCGNPKSHTLARPAGTGANMAEAATHFVRCGQRWEAGAPGRTRRPQQLTEQEPS